MNRAITIIKRNPAGEEVWRYTGNLLNQDAGQIFLEARFNAADVAFMGEIIRTGDRFLETYFTDRWYNILEIHDKEDNRLKGWYCNIGRPAVVENEAILSYVDLALDLWVAPDGTQTVLDEDEFAALELDEGTRAQARAALEELQRHFPEERQPGLLS